MMKKGMNEGKECCVRNKKTRIIITRITWIASLSGLVQLPPPGVGSFLFHAEFGLSLLFSLFKGWDPKAAIIKEAENK